MNLSTFWGGAAAAPYEIEQSLRIAQGSYLYRTNSSGGNVYTWTYSCWVKRGTFTQAIDAILAANQNYGNDWNSDSLQFHTGNYGLSIYNVRNQSTRASGTTNAKYRDPSAWMHIVAVWDNTNSTAADKFRYYINGERATISWNTTPTGDSSLINSTTPMRIGQNASVNSEKYMAEVHFIDGTAVTNANDFGEYDDNGVWRPIEYTGSYGSNGYYLKFDPSATNGVGHDHSGNGNNWSLHNIVTSGTGTDVMSDTPTNNYCTLDPINVNNSTSALAPSNGNLDLTAHFGRWGTIAVTSGKWYWEVTLTGTNSEYNYYFGAQNVQGGTVEARMMCNGGNTPDGNNISGNSNGTRTQPTGSRPSLPATIGVKLDMDNGDIEFVQGGVVNGKVTGITNWNGAVAPYISSNTTTFTYKTATLNFGQRAFSNTIPTGYSALNTANLPAPDIADGSVHFNNVLWTGNGSSQSITGVGFQPDFLWAKARNQTYWHRLHDAVRGRLNSLYTNATNPASDQANSISSFDSDGFTVGSDGSHNGSGVTYVGWNWKANGSGSANNTGTINATVSANTTAGFSIVTWTGTGSNGTLAHGLNNAPNVIIVKNRSDYTSWPVYTDITGANNYLLLDQQSKQTAGSNRWNNTAPTSTVFSVGTSDQTNLLNNNYVGYCFQMIEGYSKLGTYKGNGSSNGPFAYTGFRPAWVMIKTYAGGSEDGWFIYDNQSDPYNLSYHYLRANTANSQNTDSTNASIDILSNGFKLRHSGANTNESNTDFLYIAFAENPFGGSGVSPACAR